jgi:hypothetical protein
MESAARRLTRALTALEQRLLHDAPAASPAAGGSSGSLAADLDQARARNRALENGARQASAAMGQAAAEVRAAMTETTAPAPARTDEDA